MLTPLHLIPPLMCPGIRVCSTLRLEFSISLITLCSFFKLLRLEVTYITPLAIGSSYDHVLTTPVMTIVIVLLLNWIRVRIDPLHPHACRKWRLNGAFLRMRPEKPKVPCHSRCGTIKIPPSSKALSAEHMPKICSPSLAMITSPYE
jgi:hypothetical protein